MLRSKCKSRVPKTCYVPDYVQDNRGKCGAHFAYKGGSVLRESLALGLPRLYIVR